MYKGKIGTSSRIVGLWEGTRLDGNRAIMKTFGSIFKFDESKEGRFKLRVIEFSKSYGVSAAVSAYGVARSTVFRWKKELKQSGGKLDSLVPKSRVPVRKRKMLIDPLVLSFIKDLREKHYRLGKEKIKVLLDEYCLKNNIKTISVSTIGKIIKRNNFFFQLSGRVYHAPKYRRKISYKTKIKYSPKIQHQGYIEIDTVSEFVDGLKYYIFNAVDIYSRFQFSYAYKSLSSATATDFFKKLESVYPIQTGIKTIQTDNGLEYHGKFLEYLKSQNIPQVFIYPRCPKINGYVERANRSLREEFLDHFIDEAVDNLNNFNKLLIKHLVWFNTKRPHSSLGNLSPISFILSKHPESHMYVTQTIV
jgi:transposase InsO family protein